MIESPEKQKQNYHWIKVNHLGNVYDFNILNFRIIRF